MEELVILFLYHQSNDVTRHHFERLRHFHPRTDIVPLAYQLTVPEIFPGTLDIARLDNYGWPIRNVWQELDKIYLRWFLSPRKIPARRYVFFEYDILANTDARTFYGTAWDAYAAAAHVITPESEPGWHWWRHNNRLSNAYPFRRGVVPMAGSLWSHEAMTRIAESRQLQTCISELRMGTLANLLGMNPSPIPEAHNTFSWHPHEIQADTTQAWFHPVKRHSKGPD